MEGVGVPLIAWHEVALESLYVDEAQTEPFTGTVHPVAGEAVGDDGQTHAVLYGPAVESGAPLTMLGFRAGLPGLWGQYIVIFSVLLFAISTAISWSYYGDRCAYYLLGSRAVLPYKILFVAMHLFGALVPLAVVWSLADVFLAIVIIPNLLALLILSGQVREMTVSYFRRRPWIENAEVQRRLRGTPRGG
jgi:AGCS family alanine or glycine:cation symporter